MAKEYSEEVEKLLTEIVNHCEKEDRAIRERQVRQWRRLKLFWAGFQNVWYNEVAHDWRIWDSSEDQGSENDQGYYDKPVNIFRSYLESIIAALSITVPSVTCYPDDADDPLDLITAKAGDKIAQLVYRHNDVSLLWLHALFIFCTEGMTACYSYPKEDEEYGTYEEKQYENATENHQLTVCPLCNHVLDDSILPNDAPVTNDNTNTVNQPVNPMQMQQASPMMTSQMNKGPHGESQEELENLEKDEFMPGEDDIKLHHALNQGSEICPSCMQMMDPEIKQDSFIVTRLVGTTTKVKSRICMEVYGGLNVKVPIYARRQSECGYLSYSAEINYALAIQKYKKLKDKKNLLNKIHANPGAYDQYDQWARLSPQYQGAYPENVVTEKMTWLRPWQFNVLKNEDDIKKLCKLFPDGVKVTLVNQNFAEACPESLDDCWTVSYNPLSDYIHYDPLGMLLASIQEITNDIISLTLQTIEHGIGLTFVDPSVVSTKALSQTEVLPGAVVNTKAQSGKRLSDSFMELKTATLSGEVLPFFQQVQSLGQSTSGAQPSLFGGPIEGSNTASEYSMSRAQSLQRLQTTWKIYTTWWKNVFGKVIPMFIKEMKDDEEHDVSKDEDGNFINLFIRKAELEGKIGKIELEASENLPITWAQQKDVIMELLNAQNPQMLSIINNPENLPYLRQALGLPDLSLPGEDDRTKQYEEIKLLLNSEPIVAPPNPADIISARQQGLPPPQPQEVPSVEIDPIYDNHQVEFAIVQKWVVSEAGKQAKTENPQGYKNVLLHGQAHLQQMNQMQQEMQMQQMESQPMENRGAPNPRRPRENTKAPIKEESNVSTIQ